MFFKIMVVFVLVNMVASFILTHINTNRNRHTYTNSMQLDDKLAEVRIKCSEHDEIYVSAWDWRNCIFQENNKWSSTGNLLAQQLCIGKFCKVEITLLLRDPNYYTAPQPSRNATRA